MECVGEFWVVVSSGSQPPEPEEGGADAFSTVTDEPFENAKPLIGDWPHGCASSTALLAIGM